MEQEELSARCGGGGRIGHDVVEQSEVPEALYRLKCPPHARHLHAIIKDRISPVSGDMACSNSLLVIHPEMHTIISYNNNSRWKHSGIEETSPWIRLR